MCDKTLLFVAPAPSGHGKCFLFICLCAYPHLTQTHTYGSKQMKKTLGRVGAAMSAVALLAGGLVSVAAPAQASHMPAQQPGEANIKCYEGGEAEKVEDEVANILCSNKKAEFVGATSNETHSTYIAWGKCQDGYTPNQDSNGCETDGGSGGGEVPVQQLDVVCAYDVTKWSSDKTSVLDECISHLKPMADEGSVSVSSQKGANKKWLHTGTVSTLYLEKGLDFESPAEPSGWDACADGQYEMDGSCEEHIPVDWPESQECPDGQVLTEDGCEEEILVGEPGWQECPDGQVLTAEGCKEEILVGEPEGSSGPQAEAKEPVQMPPPPPPCWDASINNCPVGGALRFAAPRYAMVGVPVTMYAYASWRPDANAPSQPTNGTAVIRVDGEDYSGVEFKDGVAEWRFIPETEGMKEFTASGVVLSGLSGASAYIDTVPARTYVLEYDPAAYAAALKNKRVEVGDTYVITDPNQARSYLEDRYEWSVSEKSDDVCAVYETKKGAVKAKFTDSGKCTVIWMDKESEEKGKYTFIAKK